MGKSLLLTNRELMEVRFAILYAKHFHHGTDGHHRLMLINRLAQALFDEGVDLVADEMQPMNPTQSEGQTR